MKTTNLKDIQRLNLIYEFLAEIKEIDASIEGMLPYLEGNIKKFKNLKTLKENIWSCYARVSSVHNAEITTDEVGTLFGWVIKKTIATFDAIAEGKYIDLIFQTRDGYGEGKTLEEGYKEPSYLAYHNARGYANNVARELEKRNKEIKKEIKKERKK